MCALSAVIRSRLSFFFAISFPVGGAVWLGAGGEVGASEGMVAVAFPIGFFVVPGNVRRGRMRVRRRLVGICSCWSRAVPGMIRRGRGASVEWGLEVLLRPQNYPSGAKERGLGG